MIGTMLAGAWATICSVWVALLIAQVRARRAGLFLTPNSTRDARSDSSPSVCIVIPARNEADALPACIDAVLAQHYANLSVVIVDDRSEDDTAAVAEAIARREERVQLKRVTALPDGWMGKSHALWQATRGIEAEWLLFIDVDCTLEPRAVETVIHEAQRRKVEMLTLWPRQATGGFWEHMTIPLCAGIIALWFGSADAARPRRGAAFANGQFLLITRRGYERIGGHRSVRSAIIEDIPLAERAADAGLSRHIACGRDLVSVRMYDSYAAILNGWSRIYVGALRSGTKIALSILWLLFGSLLPYVVLAAFALSTVVPFDVVPPPHDPRPFLILGVVHLALILIASYRFWGMGGCRRSYLVLYPLSVLVVMRILARAWWWLIVRRHIPWRNTWYRIDRRGRIVT